MWESLAFKIEARRVDKMSLWKKTLSFAGAFQIADAITQKQQAFSSSFIFVTAF